MKKKTLIATATYNEKDNISNLFQNIINLDIEAHILIIDDNSPDNTKKIIEELTVKYSNVKLIIREKKLGLDTAHKYIFEYSIKNNYDYLITLDADLSHDTNDIVKFLKALSNNNDFVIGSRYIKGGICEMKIMRLFLSKYGNLFIRFFLNTNLHEHTTSYRGFNIKNLLNKNFDLKNVQSKGYSFFMETIYLLKKLNCNILEIPIKFKDRKFGISKIPKIELIRTLFNVIYLRIFK